MTLRAELPQAAAETETKWIINDGGAAYLPSGSLSGLALALERGATAIRVDLVLSSDDQVMILGTTRIDQLTDVAARYPERSRPDGSYYAFDFSLAELRQLGRIQEPPAGVPADHFSGFRPHIPVATLNDLLGYIDLRYRDTERKPTLNCTLRQGWLHREEGKDLGNTVLALLDSYRTASGSARFYLASYDPEELQQLAETRGSAPQPGIEFMQLIGANDGSEVRRLEFGKQQPYSYDLLFTRVGIKLVSTYASAVGLDAPVIVDGYGTVLHPQLFEDIKTLGMKVICCRLADGAYLAVGSGDDSALYEQLLFKAGFDGLLTRTDETVRQWLDDRADASASEQQQTIERLIDQIEGSGHQPPGPGQRDATM
ncbi:MAG: glycerophosphodiester phosphodiesterase family protein [Desulfofustis sp.]